MPRIFLERSAIFCRPRTVVINPTALASAACPVLCERCVRHSVQFASPSISFDSLAEMPEIKLRAKPVWFRRG
jgi:hypothetical protein